jgi:hypothetical protein
MADRWLPAGLGFDAIRHAYLAWCTATGRPHPSEIVLELSMLRWYDAHRIPAT